ncbi:hypothetical protein EJB05_27925, partial [Eragrostis curvula]
MAGRPRKTPTTPVGNAGLKRKLKAYCPNSTAVYLMIMLLNDIDNEAGPQVMGSGTVVEVMGIKFWAPTVYKSFRLKF